MLARNAARVPGKFSLTQEHARGVAVEVDNLKAGRTTSCIETQAELLPPQEHT